MIYLVYYAGEYKAYKKRERAEEACSILGKNSKLIPIRLIEG